MKTIIVANRGEIAVRIIRSARMLRMRTVALHSSDESGALHTQLADEAVELPGRGPNAYLDIEAVIEAARTFGAEYVHPGYGFLAENAEFAGACRAAGLTFVGPPPETLELFGDKVSARAHAISRGVAIPEGTSVIQSSGDAADFFRKIRDRDDTAGVMVKASAGGGGRGSAPVHALEALDGVLRSCSREAAAAFGNGDVYLEELLDQYRHIEVQVLADSRGGVTALGDRDCSIQRRRQKLIEIAPAPSVDEDVRWQLHDAATCLIRDTDYVGLATVEFLVRGSRVLFLEVNPRIQVEHTVTEEVFDVDLVQAGIRLAIGESLDELGLGASEPAPGRFAIEARVNGETLERDGSFFAATGTVGELHFPAGRGIRVDTHVHQGMEVSGDFDSLLCKIICSGSSLDEALLRLDHALYELRFDGVDDNVELLRELIESLLGSSVPPTVSYFENWFSDPEIIDRLAPVRAAAFNELQEAGALVAPVAGTVVAIEAAEGDEVAYGSDVVVIESMKMEYPLQALARGRVVEIICAVGEQVTRGQVLGSVEAAGSGGDDGRDSTSGIDDRIRTDLQEVLDRRAKIADDGRSAATEKRHAKGRMTAREHIASVVEPGTFVEIGALALAAQKRRKSHEELIEESPADGIITGTGLINGVKTAIAAYDYTVMAGTQGYVNHLKTDRILELAIKHSLPFVIFAEGGGGRPGDTDIPEGVGLISRTFELASELSGKVLTVAVVSGYCFAGNAALVGACDFVVATKDSNIGMGGPAMIEGGGLGQFSPRDIGPATEQAEIGVVDVLVEDDHTAAAAVREIFELVSPSAKPATPRWNDRLRRTVPENRLRAYDMRNVIAELVDEDAFLETGSEFAPSMVTGLCKIGGQPMGLFANNPLHNGGAIDVDGADKASRFLQICNALRLPVLSLCDTPGFMVGPESDSRASVRRFGAFFVAGAKLEVPLVTVVTRKGYGLGAMAMAGGSFRRPDYLVSWPSGEYGGMGLEGAVRLGYKKELDAQSDPAARVELYNSLLASMYETGKALNVAGTFDIDDVIDPADTASLISQTVR